MRRPGTPPNQVKTEIPTGNKLIESKATLLVPRCIPFAPVDEIVTLELVPFVPGWIVLGENAHVKLAGRPLQESDIPPVSTPDCNFAVSVNCPDAPGAIVNVLGDALMATLAADDGAPVVAAHDGV